MNMKFLEFNPEVVSEKATHILADGTKVKVYFSGITLSDGLVTFEYMEGPSNGMMSNSLKLSDMTPIVDNE